MPTIHKVFDAEDAHLFAIKLAKYGIVPPFLVKNKIDDEILVSFQLQIKYFEFLLISSFHSFYS